MRLHSKKIVLRHREAEALEGVLIAHVCCNRYAAHLVGVTLAACRLI